MNSGLQRKSKRAIVALVAAILAFVIEFQPRPRVWVRLDTPETTASWMLAVVALTFALSSMIKRESRCLLAYSALLISTIVFVHVLQLVSDCQKVE
jgi:hypothetical protein